MFAADDTIGVIQIETVLNSPISVDVQIPDDEPGKSMILKLLKPSVTIITGFGAHSYAPYGKPNPAIRSAVKIGGVLLTLLLLLTFIRKGV